MSSEKESIVIVLAVIFAPFILVIFAPLVYKIPSVVTPKLLPAVNAQVLFAGNKPVAGGSIIPLESIITPSPGTGETLAFPLCKVLFPSVPICQPPI